MKKITTIVTLCAFLLTSFINVIPNQALALARVPFLNSNAVFIPGIESSRLFTKNSLSVEDQLWEPNNNIDVQDLFLNTDGTSKKDIYTGDIIGRTNICTLFAITICPFDQNIYEDFELTLSSLKNAGVIADWKSFPYDWRLDMNKTIEGGAEQPDGSFQKITDLLIEEADSSKTGKVTIITHSNGGLFLKLLLVKLQQQKNVGQNNLIDKIDKVIMVAAPQYGTPLSLAALLHGDEQPLGPKGILLKNSVARDLGENMPTAYGLLPSAAYFQATTLPVVTFDPSISNLKNKFNLYGSNITDRNALDAFMTAFRDNRKKPNSVDLDTPNVLNPDLVFQSETLHSLIDNYIFPASIKVYAIAGIGIPTVSGITYFAKQDCVLFSTVGCTYSLDRSLINSSKGDKTVIAESAIGNVSNHYYVNLDALSSDSGTEFNHQNIMEAQPVRDFISNLLNNQDSLPSYMSTDMPDLGLVGMFNISTHSPVSLDVYDVSGKHAGVSSFTSSSSPFTFIDQDIPNSNYYQIGDESYVSVPANSQYTVKVKGLDAGSFTLNVDKTLGGQIVASSSFDDIPVSVGELAGLTIGTSASTSPLSIDTDGDGKVDLQIQPGNSLDPASYLQLLQNTILNLKLKTRLQDELFMKIQRVILMLKQGKIKQAKNAVTQFSKHLGLTKRWYKSLGGDNRDVLLNSISNFLDQFFPQ